jgi:hypothetical protein
MTANQARQSNPSNEKIDVNIFKAIQIRFPGDVYILAVWLVMSDRSKSTPRCRCHTTLLGLAGHYASLNATDRFGSLSSQDVMKVFRQHGITGNPKLTLETGAEESDSKLFKNNCMLSLAASVVSTTPDNGASEP